MLDTMLHATNMCTNAQDQAALGLLQQALQLSTATKVPINVAMQLLQARQQQQQQQQQQEMAQRLAALQMLLGAATQQQQQQPPPK